MGRRAIASRGSWGVAPLALLLGDASAAQTVRVQWVGGQVEEFRNLAVDRYWILESGKAPRVQ